MRANFTPQKRQKGPARIRNMGARWTGDAFQIFEQELSVLRNVHFGIAARYGRFHSNHNLGDMCLYKCPVMGTQHNQRHSSPIKFC